MVNQKSITYSEVGDNYETKDPVKKLFQTAAKETSKNLKRNSAIEIPDTRGESAYVFKIGNIFMASVIEGLGTKNLIADGMEKLFKKNYYNIVTHDTVATIINDWDIEDNSWLKNEKRMKDFISGWKGACNLAGVSWGGGETATMKDVLIKDTVELGGSATGIIKTKKYLLTDKKLKNKDRILLIKSNGVNANGISLTRAVAKRLKQGYGEKMPNGKTYGDGLLTKSNIYAKLIQDLQKNDIDIHYISNITGHGLRKIMRARPNFTYIIEKVFKPQEVFSFIQKHANLDDYEMYQTYNMGQDYCLFIPEGDIEKALKIVKKNKFQGLNAGYIIKGERKVIIKPKEITFNGSTLDLR